MVTEDGTAQLVTVTIHAQNDDATITGVSDGDVTEAGGIANGTPGVQTDTGDLDSDDVDNTDDAWMAVIAGTAGDNGFGTFEMSAAGVWTYTLDDTDPTVQALNGAATLTDMFTAETEDGTTQLVTVTIHAQNDTPAITGGTTGNVVEAGGVNNGTAGTPTATGNLNADDVDNPDDAWTVVAAGTASISGHGTYAVAANGTWTYTIDDTDTDVQALNGAATLTDTFNVVTEDGTTQLVTITIGAQNDDATISGTSTGDVTEAGGVANGTPGTLTDSGNLNSTDPDGADDAWTAVAAGTAGDNGFGTFAMTAAGVWTYTLDNADPTVQALNGAATLTDTLTVTTADGVTKELSVTIHAQNDIPAITGPTTGHVTEAGGVNNGTPGVATATGNLNSDDVDNTDDAWQAVAAGAATTNGYGTFGVTAAGVWTYTLDDDNADVQALNGTGTLTDTFTMQTVDGTSRVVTVTIYAQNDAATVAGGLGNTFAVGELGASINGTVVGFVTVDDPDDGTFNFSLLNDAGGRFSIHSTNGLIKVAQSSLLDFEQNTTHVITVRVADTGIFTINLTNIDPENGTGDANDNTILSGSNNDVLRGAGGNDTLSTNGGNDVLDGGTGDDTMNGGAGNDIYFVDSTNDQIIEQPGRHRACCRKRNLYAANRCGEHAPHRQRQHQRHRQRPAQYHHRQRRHQRADRQRRRRLLCRAEHRRPGHRAGERRHRLRHQQRVVHAWQPCGASGPVRQWQRQRHRQRAQ